MESVSAWWTNGIAHKLSCIDSKAPITVSCVCSVYGIFIGTSWVLFGLIASSSALFVLFETGYDLALSNIALLYPQNSP